jgi:predicted GIY-YIG superfamily endonuclease
LPEVAERLVDRMNSRLCRQGKKGKRKMDKSAIKKAYKRANQPMGIYGIRNSRDNKIFVGKASDLPARINRHKAELKFGSHRNRQLQEMWNSYGGSSFEFEILEVLDQEENVKANHDEELRVLAEMWIQKLEEAGEQVVYLRV